MGVTPPAWAATMLDAVGMPWIGVDAGQVDRQAARLSAAVQQMESAAGQVDAQLNAAVRHTGGASGQALAGFWDSAGAKAGTVAAGLALTAAAPTVLRGFAHVVRGSQVATLSQLASGMIRANAAGVVGGPLARATALASTRLGVARIRQALARGVGQTLTPAMRHHVTEPLSDVAGRIGRPAGPQPRFAGAAGGRSPAGALRMDISKKDRAAGWMTHKEAMKKSHDGPSARTGKGTAKPPHQNTNELTPEDRRNINKMPGKKRWG